MSPIRAVCFDLDLTLLDYDEPEYLRTVDSVCSDLAAAHHQVDGALLAPRYWEVQRARWAVEGQAGGADHAADGHAYWRDTWSEALAATGVHEARVADAALALYVRYRHEHYRLYDDALPALQALGGAYKLAVITNGPGTTQRDKLRHLQLEPLFDACVISGEVGYNKPGAAIFEHTLRQLGVAAGEALHIGDSLANDVAGARGAGLRAVWLNRKGVLRPPDAPAPDVEIASLAELKELLAISA
jgi:putative hydrolase of the HAD superfamily